MKYFDDLNNLKEFLAMSDNDRDNQILQWYNEKQKLYKQISDIKLDITVLECNIHDAQMIKIMRKQQ